MKPATWILGAMAASCVIAADASAQQTNIDDAHQFSWQENCGWMNWHDAGDPEGAEGVVVGATFLSGFIWCENVGWLNLGDGSPANGVNYANASGTDVGVNVAMNGRLSGLAWGENVGWVNFGVFTTLPAAQRARVDVANARLRGYAWGENIGWVNLNDAMHFVGLGCEADFDGDGFVTGLDFDGFVAAFEAGEPEADFDADGFITGLDFDAFVEVFEAGC